VINQLMSFTHITHVCKYPFSPAQSSDSDSSYTHGFALGSGIGINRIHQYPFAISLGKGLCAKSDIWAEYCWTCLISLEVAAHRCKLKTRDAGPLHVSYGLRHSEN
jgi:hypothetical protein